MLIAPGEDRFAIRAFDITVYCAFLIGDATFSFIERRLGHFQALIERRSEGSVAENSLFLRDHFEHPPLIDAEHATALITLVIITGVPMYGSKTSANPAHRGLDERDCLALVVAPRVEIIPEPAVARTTID